MNQRRVRNGQSEAVEGWSRSILDYDEGPEGVRAEHPPTAAAPGRPALRSDIQSQLLTLEMEPMKPIQEAGTTALHRD